MPTPIPTSHYTSRPLVTPFSNDQVNEIVAAIERALADVARAVDALPAAAPSPSNDNAVTDAANRLAQAMRQARNAAVGSGRRKDALVEVGVVERCLLPTLNLLHRLPAKPFSDSITATLTVLCSLALHAGSYPFPDWELDSAVLLPTVFNFLTDRQDAKTVDAALRAARALLNAHAALPHPTTTDANPTSLPSSSRLPSLASLLLASLARTSLVDSNQSTQATVYSLSCLESTLGAKPASQLDRDAAAALECVAAMLGGRWGVLVGRQILEWRGKGPQGQRNVESSGRVGEYGSLDVVTAKVKEGGKETRVWGCEVLTFLPHHPALHSHLSWLVLPALLKLIAETPATVPPLTPPLPAWHLDTSTPPTRTPSTPPYDASTISLLSTVLVALSRLSSRSAELADRASDARTADSLAGLVRSLAKQLGLTPDNVQSKAVPTGSTSPTSAVSGTAQNLDAPRGPHPGLALLAAALAALASATALSETSRSMAVSSSPSLVPLLTFLVSAKDTPILHILDPRTPTLHNPSARVSACATLRSLSRSPRLLRTNLADAHLGAVVAAVVEEEVGKCSGGVLGVPGSEFKGSSGMCEELVREAVAAMCNVVMEGKEGGKKNLLFGAEGEVKRMVISSGAINSNSSLSWDTVIGLCGGMDPDSDLDSGVACEEGGPGWREEWREPEFAVREQAMCALRNMVVGREEDIEYLFMGFGESRLVTFLENHLQWCVRECMFATEGGGDVSKMETDGESQGLGVDVRDDIALQSLRKVLYLVVNIAIGTERHKGAILGSKVLVESVKKFMTHPSGSLRTAACWVSINLTWPDDPGTPHRLSVLRDAGYPELLEHILEDPDVEVRAKARTALGAFSGTGQNSGRRWSEGGWGERERERESTAHVRQGEGGAGRPAPTLGARYGAVWGRTGAASTVQAEAVVFGTLGDEGTVDSLIQTGDQNLRGPEGQG
ncbi:hypothetical protein HDU93_006647 [Gonapodya sp. JEL0774]|nr:hypothetical protein HDU93_006647 [Gonapodya sp. JEL0774]